MSKGRLALLSGVVLWFGIAVADLDAQVIRQGGELQVNRYTTNNQYGPAVSVHADGDFVVAWSDAAQETGGNRGIFAARFDSAGQIQASEFHVNTYTPDIQHQAWIAAESNGDFVVVWQSYTQDAGSYGVFGQRFNSSGAALGVEFMVNTYTSSNQFDARIAADSDGDFVVAWESLDQDGSQRGIFGRRFASSGTALATEFMVNSFTSFNQRYPQIAIDSDGDFVVVWESGNAGDGDGYGVFAQRWSSAGGRLGVEFQVNRYTTGNQYRAVIAASASGDFVVAWQSRDQDGDNLGIFARRFSSAGVALAVEFQVNVYTTAYQRLPEIAADDSGDFIVAWESQQQDGSYEGIFARRYSAAGTAVGGEFQANSYTMNGQKEQALDWDSDGDFVIVWFTEEPQDGEADGVFAQRFSLPPLATLDVDGNGAVDALTDGLLVLRHLFGFGGTTLTNGAIGANCSRCDGASISSYLSGLGNALDIADNGGLDPLTDGLLVLRFMFGFTGTTLTNGAVGGCSTRCDAGTILAYLQTLD